MHDPMCTKLMNATVRMASDTTLLPWKPRRTLAVFSPLQERNPVIYSLNQDKGQN